MVSKMSINDGRVISNFICQAYLISVKVDSEFRYKEISLPMDNPIKRRPNIEKAIQIINWEPNYSLSRGHDLTIDHFKKILKLQ